MEVAWISREALRGGRVVQGGTRVRPTQCSLNTVFARWGGLDFQGNSTEKTPLRGGGGFGKRTQCSLNAVFAERRQRRNFNSYWVYRRLYRDCTGSEANLLKGEGACSANAAFAEHYVR